MSKSPSTWERILLKRKKRINYSKFVKNIYINGKIIMLQERPRITGPGRRRGNSKILEETLRQKDCNLFKSSKDPSFRLDAEGVNLSGQKTGGEQSDTKPLSSFYFWFFLRRDGKGVENTWGKRHPFLIFIKLTKLI